MVLLPNGDATMVPILPEPSAFVTTRPVPPRCSPSLGTLDPEAFEAKLGVWADSVVANTLAVPETPGDAMAVDGKTLRGSKKKASPGTHLLSVLSHRLGLTLTQQAVDVKTNEIKAIETVLEQIVLKGRVLTMDALLTQRQVAQTIVDKGGDYVMIVKENEPQLKADIEGFYLTANRRPSRERAHGGCGPWARRDAQSHDERVIGGLQRLARDGASV